MNDEVIHTDWDRMSDADLLRQWQRLRRLEDQVRRQAIQRGIGTGPHRIIRDAARRRQEELCGRQS